MAKKSLFGGILGKKQSKPVVEAEQVDAEANEESIEHLYITEDDKKNKKYKKKIVTKDPKIDTAILRNRIADKIAKMDNN